MRLYLLMVILLLAGCEQPDDHPALVKAVEARELAFNCWMDVDVVPIEQSGNCVGAIRALTSQEAVCEDDPIQNCDRSDTGWVAAHGLIDKAIAASL